MFLTEVPFHYVCSTVCLPVVSFYDVCFVSLSFRSVILRRVVHSVCNKFNFATCVWKFVCQKCHFMRCCLTACLPEVSCCGVFFTVCLPEVWFCDALLIVICVILRCAFESVSARSVNLQCVFDICSSTRFTIVMSKLFNTAPSINVDFYILPCVLEGHLSRSTCFFQSGDAAELAGTSSAKHRYLITWKLEPYNARSMFREKHISGFHLLPFIAKASSTTFKPSRRPNIQQKHWNGWPQPSMIWYPSDKPPKQTNTFPSSKVKKWLWIPRKHVSELNKSKTNV